MSGKIHTVFYLSLLMFVSLQFRSCYRELITTEAKLSDNMERVIGFDNIYAFTDTTSHLLLYSLGADTIPVFTPLVNYKGYQSICLDGKVLEEGTKNEIGQVIINHPYQLIAMSEEVTDTFSLVFTPFPIAQLITEEEIKDEPKIVSWMELQYYDPDMQDHNILLYESYAGVEIRGHSSTHFEKKQYGIELWKNQFGADRSAHLLGMRYAEDWILDAMSTDDMRMRSKLAFELWEKIIHDYPAVHRKYIELFINNRYEGIYCLGERMDENILRFSSDQNEKGGVLYKAIDKAEGSTRFEVYQSEPVNSLTWDGWELIFPTDEYYWDPLAELRKTVVLTSDDDFTDSINALIDLENVADYYLYLNLLLAYDNVGKNNFYARYSEHSRFFIMPQDVDYTWGRMYERRDCGPAGIIENRLFQRLIENDVDDFNDLLEERWEEHRKNAFHKDTLLSSVDKYYNILKKSGAIVRENSRWEDVQVDLEYEYEYISDWIEQRLHIMDDKFDE